MQPDNTSGGQFIASSVTSSCGQKYNPEIHHRRSIRLKGYDYSQAGAYFITICCHHRKHRFGKIIDGEMVLNEFGTIARDQWLQLPDRFANIELDAFQIMPNHMHGIIVVPVGATLAVAPVAAVTTVTPHDGADDYDAGVGASPARTTSDGRNHHSNCEGGNATIGDIVGAYKSLVAYTCLNVFKVKNETIGQLWQRNYYEHIIRNEKAHQTISDYITNNPQKWVDDKFFI